MLAAPPGNVTIVPGARHLKGKKREVNKKIKMKINRSWKRSRHGDVRRAVREAFVNGLPPAAAAPSAEASRALPRPSATLLCGLGSVPGLALDQLRTAGLVSLPLNSRGEGGGEEGRGPLMDPSPAMERGV